MKFLGILLILAGIPFLLIPIIGIPLIIVGIIVILSSIGSSNAEKTAKAIAETVGTGRTAGSDSMARWHALVDVDPDIAAAAAKARAAGADYERQLAEKYLTLNDKQYLAAALEKVLAQGPSTGQIGNCTFQRKPDGRYVITRGFCTGRTFATYDDMHQALS